MMRYFRYYSKVLLLICLPFTANALTAEQRMESPAMEQQAREIFKQIRCVVCSGESINDSNAGLAKEIRVLIRKQLNSGKNEQQIIDMLVVSYGDEILMKPPLNQNTLLLWGAPLLFLLFGAGFIALFFRKNK